MNRNKADATLKHFNSGARASEKVKTLLELIERDLCQIVTPECQQAAVLASLAREQMNVVDAELEGLLDVCPPPGDAPLQRIV